MDNLDKIKFKEAESSGWYYKIDLVTNQKISFANGKGSGTGLYKEMETWVAAGNVIEPQYTPEEQVQKEIDDLQNALDSQKSQCIQLLNDSEKAVSTDPPYPNDIDTWKTIRQQWRDILKMDSITNIPEKPF